MSFALTLQWCVKDYQNSIASERFHQISWTVDGGSKEVGKGKGGYVNEIGTRSPNMECCKSWLSLAFLGIAPFQTLLLIVSLIFLQRVLCYSSILAVCPLKPRQFRGLIAEILGGWGWMRRSEAGSYKVIPTHTRGSLQRGRGALNREPPLPRRPQRGTEQGGAASKTFSEILEVLRFFLLYRSLLFFKFVFRPFFRSLYKQTVPLLCMLHLHLPLILVNKVCNLHTSKSENSRPAELRPQKCTAFFKLQTSHPLPLLLNRSGE